VENAGGGQVAALALPPGDRLADVQARAQGTELAHRQSRILDGHHRRPEQDSGPPLGVAGQPPLAGPAQPGAGTLLPASQVAAQADLEADLLPGQQVGHRLAQPGRQLVGPGVEAQ
jgi:hypothetical protein